MNTSPRQTMVVESFLTPISIDDKLNTARQLGEKIRQYRQSADVLRQETRQAIIEARSIREEMRDLLVSSHDTLLSEDDAERSFRDSDDEDTIISAMTQEEAYNNESSRTRQQ
jgi:hypothetical protein